MFLCFTLIYTAFFTAFLHFFFFISTISQGNNSFLLNLKPMEVEKKAARNSDGLFGGHGMTQVPK